MQPELAIGKVYVYVPDYDQWIFKGSKKAFSATFLSGAPAIRRLEPKQPIIIEVVWRSRIILDTRMRAYLGWFPADEGYGWIYARNIVHES